MGYYSGGASDLNPTSPFFDENLQQFLGVKSFHLLQIILKFIPAVSALSEYFQMLTVELVVELNGHGNQCSWNNKCQNWKQFVLRGKDLRMHHSQDRYAKTAHSISPDVMAVA